MGFFKNLLSRAPKSSSEALGTRVVPPGHHLTRHWPTEDPVFVRTEGGVFIASLGSASDEFQDEFRRIAEEVDRSIAVAETEPAPPVLLSSENSLLSELFAPHDPEVKSIPGLLIWVLDAGIAELWLGDLDLLLAGVRRAQTYQCYRGPITQVVMLAVRHWHSATGGEIQAGMMPRPAPPPGTWELAERLSALGVAVSAIPEDGNFFLEVCRPEAVIGALRTEPVPRDATPGTEGVKPGTPPFVVRASRLRRLTLASFESRTEITQLFEELLSRKIALLVISDPRGKISVMSWPGFGEALPVYPDLSSLLQAARDLKLNPNSLAWAHFLPRDLFTWADQQPFGGVALNVYVDPTRPKYFMIDKTDLHSLACGRIPEVRETVQ